MAKPFPLNPAHPERTCWGCDRFCSAKSMQCGNGSERTQHPAELFGPDWHEWMPPVEPPAAAAGDATTAATASASPAAPTAGPGCAPDAASVPEPRAGRSAALGGL